MWGYSSYAVFSKVGAKREGKVTAEERTELLSRNAVDVHNSSVDKSGGSGIIESKKKSNFVPAKTKQEAKEVLDNGIM